MEKFEKVLNIDRSNEEEVSNFEKVFKLIDKDDDGKIDFPELMIFIFTIDENLSRYFHIIHVTEWTDNCH